MLLRATTTSYREIITNAKSLISRERAKELQKKKQSWCLEAAAVKERGIAAEIPRLFDGWPDNNVDYLEYDSTIAMLNGKIGVNVHCYEPEDFEDMLRHSKEFGFRIQAFHHALSAVRNPMEPDISYQSCVMKTMVFSQFLVLNGTVSLF
jgi:hypothetical protein